MSSGKLWDDLGSTAFVDTGGPGNAKSTTDTTKRMKLRKKMDESSDDELDFLSSGSRSDDVVETGSKPRAKKKQPGKASIQGRQVDHHLDYPPKKKFPDFKKITHTAPEEGSSSTSQGQTFKIKQKTSKQTKEYEILATLHDNENKLPALSDGLSSDELIHASPQRGVQQFPGLTLSPLRTSDQGSPHLDTPRSNTKDAISYKQHKQLHNKISSDNPETNNRSTPTSIHASRIQSSDSSDSSEATPRAKHSKTRFRKLPTLDPLSVSDSMAPELDGGKGKAPSASRVPSQTHRRIHSDMTTPRKSSKSRYPFPSPLSSPAHQLSPDSTTVLRKKDSRGCLNITAAEDADDESQKRPQLRPFPMGTSHLKSTTHSPCRTITCAQPAYSNNTRNHPFSSDLDVFGDDSRQRRLSMLVVRILIGFQFLWGTQRIRRASVLSVMKSFHLTLRHSIAPFSKLLDARRVLIRVQLTLVGLKL
jgi:hypothetical protein